MVVVADRHWRAGHDGATRGRAQPSATRDADDWIGAGGALGSWVVLVVVLGNVGLQQTMSLGPLRPDGRSWPTGRWAWWRPSRATSGRPAPPSASAAPGIVALLAIDLVAATVATFLIGELGLVDLPAVLVVITGVGLQPLGFLVGSTVAGWRASASYQGTDGRRSRGALAHRIVRGGRACRESRCHTPRHGPHICRLDRRRPDRGPVLRVLTGGRTPRGWIPSLIIGVVAAWLVGFLLVNVAHVDAISSIWLSALLAAGVAVVLRLLLKTFDFAD